jgi:hypothetical protein
MMQTFELVVAHCNEDLAWLRRVPPQFRVTLYHKGAQAGIGTRLPNVGREAQTYLHHLAKRLDDLADVTVFVQGHPFDHAPDLHARLRELVSGDKKISDFWWLGFVADTDDARGRRLFVPWSKNPAHEELDMETFHRRLFRAPGPSEYRFFVGGQFILSRQAAKRRATTFYEMAKELAANFPMAPHCFERCWDRIFMSDGTIGRLPDGQKTAYFKPLRRLAQPTGAR